jgi:hypothetical protein
MLWCDVTLSIYIHTVQAENLTLAYVGIEPATFSENGSLEAFRVTLNVREIQFLTI